MKKKKINRKLPRYDLGTMKRLPLGYQQANGNGYASTSVEQGQSIQPEINAMRANRTPMAIGQMTQSFQYPMQMLQKNLGTLGAVSASTTAANAASPFLTTAANGTATGINSGSNLAASLFEHGAGKLSSTAGSSTGSSAAVGAGAGASTLGMVAGGLGTLYGGWNMFNQFADANRHRSAADMQRTLNKYTFTTPGGNQYTEYGGVNAGDELSYEREAGHQKRTAQLINTAGTGASIGGLVASTGVLSGTKLGGALGSWAGPVGVGVGALLGAGIGGLINLFGFGDNEEEVKEQIRRENDAIAMQNMQNRAVGKSRDLESSSEGKPAFGHSQKTTKHGSKVEQTFGPYGFRQGIAKSMIAEDESTYDPLNMVGTTPIGKGHADNVPSYIEPGDQNMVFSNDKKAGAFAKKAAPIIEQQNKLHSIIANANGNSRQQQFQKMMAEKALEKNNNTLLAMNEAQNIVRDNNMKIKKYNCGKLPGYKLGTMAEYALATLPHIGGMMSNIAQYNRAKYADTPIQSSYVEDTLGREALNDLNGLRYDIDPYINQARKALAAQNWATRRNVNLGYGGRALAQNANFQSYLNALYSAYDAKNKAENEFITTKANAKARLGAASTDRMINSINGIISRSQQQNAQKLLYEDTKLRDIYTMGAAAVNAFGDVSKYLDAKDIQNAQIGLWKQTTDTDRMKVLADTQRLATNNQQSTTTQRPYIPTSMLLGIGKKYQFQQPSYLNIMDDEYWNWNGRRFMS